jgi:hypothetical protein
MKKIILYLLLVIFLGNFVNATIISDSMYLSINETLFYNSGCNFLGDCGGILSCNGNNIKSYDLSSFGFNSNDNFNLTFDLSYTNPAQLTKWILYDGIDYNSSDVFGIFVENGKNLNGEANISIPKYSTQNNNSGWGKYNLIHNESGYYIIQDDILLISGNDTPTNELNYFYFGGGSYSCMYNWKLEYVSTILPETPETSQFTGVPALLLGMFVLFGLTTLFVWSINKFRNKKMNVIEFVVTIAGGLIGILILKGIIDSLI